MFFLSTALVLAAIPAAVLGAVHTVTVGAGGLLAYNPNNITAAVGDQVNFEFQAKNHVCCILLHCYGVSDLAN